MYLAQLIWPDWPSYPDVDTAFVYVAGRAGGPILFAIVNLALLVATSAQARERTSARAGSSTAWAGQRHPAPVLRRLNPRTHIPSNNVLFVGALALVGAFAVNYRSGPSC